jgi:lipopolysaccharide export system permease protein
MKRLYSYVIKSFIGPFILTFFICIFILLMMFLWKYLDDMVGKGLETKIIVELMTYAAMDLISMALPLSILLASIMTFGTLGERFELIAMKASGVSLLKIMRPLIFLNVGITIFAFVMANNVVPVTNSKFAALLWSVKEQRPEMIIKEGVFSNEIDGYSIKVNHRDQKTDALQGVMIYDHTAGKGNVNVTIADSGYLNMSDDKKFMILTLFNGISYSDMKQGDKKSKETHPFQREKFKREELVIDVHNFELKRADEKYFQDGYKMLNIKQLDVAVDSLNKLYNNRIKLVSTGVAYNVSLNEQVTNNFNVDSLKTSKFNEALTINYDFDSLFSKLNKDRKSTVLVTAQRNAQANQRNVIQFEDDMKNRLIWMNKHALEWHRKFTLSIACLIFFFIGAPLGAIIRKGGFGMPVVISIVLFISYYLVSMIGEKVAREGVLVIGYAMWFSSAVFMIVGVFLTRQAVTDSVLMNSETYSKFFKRLNFLKFFNSEKIEPELDEDTVPNE